MKTVYYIMLGLIITCIPMSGHANSLVTNLTELQKSDLAEVDLSTYSLPFSDKQELKLVVHDPGFVKIEIMTPQGSKVCDLLSREMQEGKYSFYWNGRDMAQQYVESGVYICVLSFGQKRMMRTLTLLR